MILIFLTSTLSLFQLHNETINIWTHIIAACIFLYLGIYHSEERVSVLLTEKYNAHFMIEVHCYFASCTYLLSATFHLYRGVSEEISNILVKLDYFGIFVTFFGSMLSGLFFTFYCYEDLVFLYQTGITILIVPSIIISLTPKFSEVRYTTMRVAVYGIVGLYSFLPIGHQIYIHGVMHQEIVDYMKGFFLMLLLYMTGMVFYQIRFPEVCWPGKFDLLGQSHQIFHILTAIATFIHYMTLLQYYKIRTTYGCAAANDVT